MANKNNPGQIHKAFYAPSDDLRTLRMAIRSLPQIEAQIGNSVQFRIVLDTNVVLADLKWLSKRKKTKARTYLLEVIESGSVKAYAPSALFAEVDEHLPVFAEEQEISLEIIQCEWELYKPRLIICDPSEELKRKYSIGIDNNDDVDFVALAEEIHADAIYSEDKHIEAMGGQTVTLDFIVNVKDYARASALELSIKYRGIMIGVVSIEILVELIKGIIALFSRIPPWLKILMFVVALGFILHPKSREKITNYLSKASSGIKEIMPDVLEGFGQIVAFTEQQKAEANKYLNAANAELERIQNQEE